MAQPTTAGAWLNGVSDMLLAVGMDPGPIFEQAGIDAASVREPHHRFDSDQLSRLWQVIAETSGDPAIALGSFDRPRPVGLDMLAYTMMTAPDMSGALQRMVRYIRIISDATTFSLDADGTTGHWLRLTIEGGLIPVPRQRYEFILITLLNICRWIAGKTLNPLCVEFANKEPGNTAPYAKAFASPLRFGVPVHGMLFSAADLAAPLPASNARLAELHERFADDFLLQMDSSKITTKVRKIFVHALPDGEPPRCVVAAALCISERTLQRRLKEEGTTFQQLGDDIRRDLARQFLAEDQTTLGQIAFMLGFADQSAFSRACQRWFTLSPRQLRQKLTVHAAP